MPHWYSFGVEFFFIIATCGARADTYILFALRLFCNEDILTFMNYETNSMIIE